jgi:hypothetical protein
VADSEEIEIRGSIRAVLKRFLNNLQSHLSNKEYRNFLFGNTRLDEVELKYKPESYTCHNLVNPLLRAVDLQFQPEPRTTDVTRTRWPDFEVTNAAIPYIGEVKPANCVDDGEDEIREYLGIDGFRTPYGILTDGIRWEVYGPPERSKDVSAEQLKRASLLDALKVVAQVEGYCEISALSGEANSNGIAEIERFESAFNRDRLDGWALEQLTRRDREEFSTDGRSLQSSLEASWK